MFSVVAFFETTEYTEVELHQTISTNTFSLCSLWLPFLKPQSTQRRNCIKPDL